MNSLTHDRSIHRYAVLTATVALLPIGMGALVTTLDAGMAFLDWPTSDGYFLFLYPWLKDFHANRDKFVEHGHRLGGSLIGLFSIGLMVWSLKVEPRRWVRWLSAAILLAVIGQGLLGGLRVIQDSRLSALVHGQFAALIFSAISVVALVTGRRWMEVTHSVPERNSSRTRERSEIGAEVGSLTTSATTLLVIATPLAVLGQSVVGAFVRHLGFGLHEHLAGALIATGLTLATIVVGWRTGHAWLRSGTIGLLCVLLVQLCLGAGAWVTRFGFPPTGFVAVQQAPEQIVFRTAHAVAAMFVLMMSVQLAARVLRLNWLARKEADAVEAGFRLPAVASLGLSTGGSAR